MVPVVPLQVPEVAVEIVPVVPVVVEIVPVVPDTTSEASPNLIRFRGRHSFCNQIILPWKQNWHWSTRST